MAGSGGVRLPNCRHYLRFLLIKLSFVSNVSHAKTIPTSKSQILIVYVLVDH